MHHPQFLQCGDQKTEMVHTANLFANSNKEPLEEQWIKQNSLLGQGLVSISVLITKSDKPTLTRPTSVSGIRMVGLWKKKVRHQEDMGQSSTTAQVH
jgi:hypothetical protein